MASIKQDIEQCIKTVKQNRIKIIQILFYAIFIAIIVISISYAFYFVLFKIGSPTPPYDPNVDFVPLIFLLILIILYIIFKIKYGRIKINNKADKSLFVAIVILLPLILTSFVIRPYPMSHYFFIEIKNKSNTTYNITVFLDSKDILDYEIKSNSYEHRSMDWLTWENHNFEIIVDEANFHFKENRKIDYSITLRIMIDNTSNIDVLFYPSPLM